MKHWMAMGLIAVGLLAGCHRNTRKDPGERAEDAVESAGDKVEDAADKAGDKIEDATDKN